ncbi:MAG: tetratricopeptide repeat protein [Acidobacteriota bacterium]|nr:tetratricopeptide repeat protein [Acidobacteriota bacterium]
MFTLAKFFLSAALLLGQQAGPLRDLPAAQRAEQAGDFKSAETIYVQLLAQHPHVSLYQRLGLVRHMQNKFSSAADAFKSAVHLDPSLWSSHLFLGIDLYRMNQFADADSQLDIANQLHPNEPEILFWSGATKLARHDFMSGFEILESVLERDPSNAEVLRMLAESYATFGTSLLNEVGERYPNSPAGLIVQAQAFEFEGSYGPALESYHAAQALDPDRPGLPESILRIEALLRK